MREGRKKVTQKLSISATKLLDKIIYNVDNKFVFAATSVIAVFLFLNKNVVDKQTNRSRHFYLFMILLT